MMRFGRCQGVLSRNARRIAAGCVAVVLVGATVTVLDTSSAFADSTIDGCTIVSAPTPTHFTNCPGANLAGANLANLNLSYANLQGATFATATVAPPVSANLTGTVFFGANLQSAAFATCAIDLNGPTQTCTAAELGGANFTLANVARAAFFGADLTNAKFTFANVTGAVFAMCSFPEFSCKVAGGSGVDFRFANMTNAITSSCGSLDLGDDIGVVYVCAGASLSDATMVHANLTGVDLSRTGLPGANLTRAKGLDGDTFSTCISDHIDGDLCSATNFSNADLAAQNLSALNMKGIDFAGANLSGASLAGSDLSPLVGEFTFDKAANFAGANLRRANLSGANLTDATFAGAQLSHANFTGANLTGANMTDSARAHVMWSNTTCPDGTNSNNDGNTCEGHLSSV
jgi:uncharacterized protein YjbI with pentapeptide repeats